MPEAPAATPVLSTTSTSSPRSARCQAVESPWTPAPTIRVETERMSVNGRSPIRSHRTRALDPRAQLGLGELAVLLLQPDAVRVAGLEVLDEHLARDLVAAPLRDREVDLDEGVRVAVEHGGGALLLEQLHVLEPVDVLAGRGRLQVDVLDQRHLLLVGEALA